MNHPNHFSLPVVSSQPQPLPESLGLLWGGDGAPSPLRQLDSGAGCGEAAEFLRHVWLALQAYGEGAAPVVFSLHALSPDARRRIAETLGEGEVVLTVTGTHVFQIEETSLAGVWWVQDAGSGPGEKGAARRGDFLEVGDVPGVVRAANAEATCCELSIGDPPAGAMNALPVLAELRHRMKSWKPGSRNHVVSFTLLPMNEIDMRTLEAQLGHGPVRAEARGLGSCKVELTGHRNLWSVQFFNPAGVVILDTIEVGDVPVALRAATEDLADSAQRLQALLSCP